QKGNSFSSRSGTGDGVGSQPKVLDELQDMTTGINNRTGTIPEVLDVPNDQSKSENESWGESGDDNDSNDDDDENPNLNQKDYDIEEDNEDEYVPTPSSYESTDDENKHVDEEEHDHIDEELYKDVNVKLKDVEHGEEWKGDAEKTDAGHDDVTQESSYDQVKDDEHVTLTAVNDTQKTERNQYLRLQTSRYHRIKEVIWVTLMINQMSRLLQNMRSLTPDLDWNARKLVDFRPPQTSISKIAQAEKPLLSVDELMSTLIDFSAYVMNNLKIDNLTQEHLVGPAFNLLKGTCRSRMELEYNIEECYKAITDRLDWNNPKGKEYSFVLSKPLQLIIDQGHQVIPVD
nr:hypothetical protein [Tanacetum cinerariifolium]